MKNYKYNRELKYLRTVLQTLADDGSIQFERCQKWLHWLGGSLLVIGLVIVFLLHDLTLSLILAVLLALIGSCVLGISEYMKIIASSWPFLRGHLSKCSIENRINELEKE